MSPNGYNRGPRVEDEEENKRRRSSPQTLLSLLDGACFQGAEFFFVCVKNAEGKKNSLIETLFVRALALLRRAEPRLRFHI